MNVTEAYIAERQTTKQLKCQWKPPSSAIAFIKTSDPAHAVCDSQAACIAHSAVEDAALAPTAQCA